MIENKEGKYKRNEVDFPHPVPLCLRFKLSLYLPGTKDRKYIYSVEPKKETNITQLFNCFENSKGALEIKIKSPKIENTRKIKASAGFKTCRSFVEIEKRKLHSKLYNAKKMRLYVFSTSRNAQRKGIIKQNDELSFCYIKDINVFCRLE
ncbi:hypothetical protein CWI38_0122p0030 [Hamiltosporidium tvaerminnensis]|uniref:Uncharacterized protein n=1 Tax=Hamiltosporidium tvaerminnensis TaxID=1176355 RepID=A0A4Q9M0J9_9MICR|nr:hypothetical protein CWI38_0122p0030 [Hamiltosporidium tvaerminnensis]